MSWAHPSRDIFKRACNSINWEGNCIQVRLQRFYSCLQPRGQRTRIHLIHLCAWVRLSPSCLFELQFGANYSQPCVTWPVQKSNSSLPEISNHFYVMSEQDEFTLLRVSPCTHLFNIMLHLLEFSVKQLWCMLLWPRLCKDQSEKWFKICTNCRLDMN